MPIAIDPNATVDYILECDRKKEKEDQTVFELRWLTAQELARLEDGSLTSIMSKENRPEFQIHSGSMQIKTLQIGLVGWRNFRDKDGNEIDFKQRNDQCAKENLDYLHPQWRRELVEAITEMNQITEDETKNLSSEDAL